jgi:hypothetical protein
VLVTAQQLNFFPHQVSPVALGLCRGAFTWWVPWCLQQLTTPPPPPPCRMLQLCCSLSWCKDLLYSIRNTNPTYGIISINFGYNIMWPK